MSRDMSIPDEENGDVDELDELISPRAKTEWITAGVRIQKEWMEAIKAIAAATGRTRNRIITTFIKSGVRRYAKRVGTDGEYPSALAAVIEAREPQPKLEPPKLPPPVKRGRPK